MANQTTGLLSPFLRKKRIEAAKPYLRGNVLDFGCGIGVLAGSCSPTSYLGVDIDEESIAIAKKRNPSHRFDSSVVDGECFDSIVMLALIEHIPDPGLLLSHLKKMLRTDGRIIITTPHPIAEAIHFIGSRVGLFSLEANAEHEHLINYKSMLTLATGSGLTIDGYKRFLLGCNQLFVLK